MFIPGYAKDIRHPLDYEEDSTWHCNDCDMQFPGEEIEDGDCCPGCGSSDITELDD